MDDSVIDEVIRFWFDAASKPYWFRRSDSFDRAVADLMLGPHEAAASGACDHWMSEADGSLALCILLDQAPRNMFRGTPRAFATDAKALAVADHAVRQGLDMDFDPEERVFLYLPFEHQEDLGSQRRSVALFRERVAEGDYVFYAERHLEVIERFGRFPHRNIILGRESTPEELAFLKEENSSF